MEDGFKKLPKMQCFNTGGVVNAMCSGGKTYKKGGHAESEEMKKDVKQDKAIIKKAFKMHDEQEHKGEKTDLSKLKKGGRMKKAVGTVKKYQTGGSVNNIYGAKKKAGDLDAIEKTKAIKPAKAAAPSKGTQKAAASGATNVMRKGGAAKKSVKKMEDGKLTAPLSSTEKARLRDRYRNKMMLSPSQQAELDAQEAALKAQQAGSGVMGGGIGDAMGSAVPVGQRKGGSVCR